MFFLMFLFVFCCFVFCVVFSFCFCLFVCVCVFFVLRGDRFARFALRAECPPCRPPPTARDADNSLKLKDLELQAALQEIHDQKGSTRAACGGTIAAQPPNEDVASLSAPPPPRLAPTIKPAARLEARDEPPHPHDGAPHQDCERRRIRTMSLYIYIYI